MAEPTTENINTMFTFLRRTGDEYIDRIIKGDLELVAIDLVNWPPAITACIGATLGRTWPEHRAEQYSKFLHLLSVEALKAYPEPEDLKRVKPSGG